MTRTVFSLAALFSSALLATPSVLAQSVIGSSIRFGLAGGPVAPLGDAGATFDTGWHVQGMVGFSAPFSSFGVRADVVYQSLSARGEGDVHFAGGQLNALWKLPPIPASSVRPYVLGAGGAYYERLGFGAAGARTTESATRLGLSGGAGISFELSGVSSFVEARYLTLFIPNEHTNVVPITVGVMLH